MHADGVGRNKEGARGNRLGALVVTNRGCAETTSTPAADSGKPAGFPATMMGGTSIAKHRGRPFCTCLIFTGRLDADCRKMDLSSGGKKPQR